MPERRRALIQRIIFLLLNGMLNLIFYKIHSQCLYLLYLKCLYVSAILLSDMNKQPSFSRIFSGSWGISHDHYLTSNSLQWPHNERGCASNHRRLDCLLNRLFRRRSKGTSKLPVTCPSEWNPPVAGGFPSQRPCKAENVSNWWRHHSHSISSRQCTIT